MMRTLADRVAAVQAGGRAGEADELLSLIGSLEADALVLLVPSAAVDVSLHRLRDAARGCVKAAEGAQWKAKLEVFEAALYRLAMAADHVALDEAKAAGQPEFDRGAVPNPIVRAA